MAISASVRLKCKCPWRSMNGNAWNGFADERRNVIVSGSPNPAISLPEESTTAMLP